MLVNQIWCSLTNLGIWISFTTSVHFIAKKKFYLVIWARKEIIYWLLLISFSIVLLPLIVLFGLSCYIESEQPFAAYLAACYLVLMTTYIFMGRKLLRALEMAFNDTYKKIRW